MYEQSVFEVYRVHGSEKFVCEKNVRGFVVCEYVLCDVRFVCVCALCVNESCVSELGVRRCLCSSIARVNELCVSEMCAPPEPAKCNTTPATQSERKCQGVPRMPRKVRCYQPQSSVNPAGLQYSPSGVSARPATQNLLPSA